MSTNTMNKPTLQEIGHCLRPIGLYRCEVRKIDWSYHGYEPFEELFAEPRGRQRLDHYGNDGEGWCDSWYDDYAWPIEEKAKELISSKFGAEVLDLLSFEVGEKGFIRAYFIADIVRNKT